MSAKSETDLGVLFSDLALRISLNFTWNWSIRLFDSSDFNNVCRFESCRRYSWTWPIGFWRRGMQIKLKGRINRYMDRIAGLLTAVRPGGIIVKAREMYTYESYTHVCAFWLLTLRFRKNNGRSNTAEIRRLWQGVRSPPILKEFSVRKKENVGAKINSYWSGQVWYFSSAKARRTVLYTHNNKMPLSSKPLEKRTLNQLNREITFRTELKNV